MLRLSRLYGTDIFTDNAELIGKVNDIILNLEKGEVVRLTTHPLHNITKDEAREILRRNSVLYKNVKSARDVIIVSKLAHTVEKDLEAELEPAEKTRKTLGRLAGR